MPKNIKNIPQRWTAAWISTSSDLFMELWSPEGRFTDHAIQFTSYKHPALQRHFQGWRDAHDDFECWIDQKYPVLWTDVDEQNGNGKCSFKMIEKGVFVRDLPAKKASGRSWEFSLSVDLVIENGLITKCDEWYRNSFDEGVAMEQYKIRV
ncbi:hypothetical protein GQ53DRAFT_833693 [Thozetella sp. PMI_491]|nr:hypothetical protein GQ53DRAFT_833693 [Thozetella sp. PMI_491]